jgi:Flp pilus assembly protein CpaB
MNPKALIPLIAGLAIAGLAAKLGFDQIKKARGASVETVSLWAPLDPIPRGTAITEQMLTAMDFPRNLAPGGAFTNKQKLVGRVPATTTPAGVPIVESMLLPPGTSPGVFVPPGYRAVAVKVDESTAVGNHLEPGVFVDVVGLFTVRQAGRAETVARTVIENVEVAAVGQRLAPETPQPGDPEGRNSRPAKPPRAVVLLVKPDQVPIVHLAEQRGKIKLSMRGTTRDQTLASQMGDNDMVEEGSLLGLSEPKGGEKSNTFMDRVAKMFDSVGSKPKPTTATPTAEPQAEPQPEENVELAWTMVVYNGDKRTVLGFPRANPFEPIQLMNEPKGEGPNVFENENWNPPAEPPTRANPPEERLDDQGGDLIEDPIESDSEDS